MFEKQKQLLDQHELSITNKRKKRKILKDKYLIEKKKNSEELHSESFTYVWIQ